MFTIRSIVGGGLGLASLLSAMSSSPLQAQGTQDHVPPTEYHERLRQNEPGQYLGERIETSAYVPQSELYPCGQDGLQNRREKQLRTPDPIQRNRQKQAQILSLRQLQAFMRQDREEQRLLKWELRKKKESVWREEREFRREFALLAQERQELAKQDRQERKASSGIPLSAIAWPKTLETPSNKEKCRRIQALAHRHVLGIDVEVELAQAIRDLDADLVERVEKISPRDYAVAKRFLQRLLDQCDEAAAPELAIQ